MTTMTDTRPAFTASPEVEALARLADWERWVATLFAPEAKRPALVALLAFSAEIARVRDIVSDPMPGEIRLRWWRDMLTGERRAEAAGHPVAAALLDTIERHRLPVAALVDLIDARIFDLYDDPMPTMNDLEGYCGETSSALIQLAALVLNESADPGTADVAGHAGVAYAITGLCRAFAFHASRGQVYMPLDVLAKHGVAREDIVAGRATPGLVAALGEVRARARHHLARARALAASIPEAARPAFLHLALADPALDRLDRAGTNPFGPSVEAPTWRRQWTLWRAARRGRPLG
jgi:15-cis-phytoene synthase